MTTRLAAAVVAALLFGCHASTPKPAPSTPKRFYDRSGAKTKNTRERGWEVLRRDVTVTVDPRGLISLRRRQVVRIRDERGVKAWGMLSEAWAPWHEARPRISARVTTADGAVHELDPSTIAESPIRQLTPNLVSNRRVVQAPLPAVGVGSVVDYTVQLRRVRSLAGRGGLIRVFFAPMVPTRRVRIVVEAPQEMAPGTRLRHEVLGLKARSRREVKGGKRRWVYEAGPFESYPTIEAGMPAEIPRVPQLALSTAGSWSDVARAYAAVVERQIAAGQIPPLIKKNAGLSRRQLIARVVAEVRRRVRYTGVEFDEAEVEPRPPRVTLRRGYGDCKDQSTLVVAALRAVGVKAHVALLRTGPGQELAPGLPALGAFDHAIVVVPGEAPLWIDPVAPHVPVGQLPSPDIDRRALVARGDSDGRLQRTPSPDIRTNHCTERREFRLAVSGGARVKETVRARGVVASIMRRQAHGRAKAYDEQLEGYAKRAYLSSQTVKTWHSDPADLTHPFEVRLEMKQADRGYTTSTDASVGLDRGVLFEWLPMELKPGASGKREHDLVLEQPYSYELRYRIVPPRGYRARQPLPASGTKRLGPATLSTTYRRLRDQTVLATFRFSTVKRRYTAAEVKAFREGLEQLLKPGPPLVSFDHRGALLLKQGKVRRALKAYRELVAAARGSDAVLQRCRYAEALCAAGFGQAARAEARRAVQQAPTSARARRTLGWVLEHDRFGVQFGKGHDRAGAIAAYRKGRKLDPKDPENRARLALLLEHDSSGNRYSSRSDLAGAVAEWRALQADLDNHDYDESLLVALLYHGKLQEAIELAPKVKTTGTTVLEVLLTATTVLKGPQAALRRVAGKPAAEQQKLMATVLTNLLHLRRYGKMADLMAALGSLAKQPGRLDAVIRSMRRVRRYDRVRMTRDTPVNLVRRFLIAMMLNKVKPDTLDSWFASVNMKNTDNSTDALRRWGGRIQAMTRTAGVSAETGLDMLTLARFKVEGDADATRVQMTIEADHVDKSMQFTWYAVRERAGWRLLGLEDAVDALGLQALRLHRRGRTAAARRLLKWARAAMPTALSSSVGSPFLHLWRPGRARVRVAAAALAAESDAPEPAIAVLREALKRRNDPTTRFQLNRALSTALHKTKRHAELVEVCDRLLAHDPSDLGAYFHKGEALHELKRLRELEQLARTRLQANPADGPALIVLADIAGRNGKFRKERRLLLRAVKGGKALPMFYGALGWNALFMRPLHRKALDWARKATRGTQDREGWYHATLAAIQAELGHLTEARTAWLESRERRMADGMEGLDWFLEGRLAERAGLRDVARRAYSRIKPPKRPRSNSVHALAKRARPRR